MSDNERERRWRLAVGGDDQSLSKSDRRLSEALSALYGDGTGQAGPGGTGQRGGLGSSSPKVAKWLGDIREYFSSACSSGCAERRFRSAWLAPDAFGA